MKRSLLLIVATLAVAALGAAEPAGAIPPCGCRHVDRYPWHGGYYHTALGAPVALVVPPTVETQTHWGWGVGNTRVTPICHQFHRHWPGPGYSNRGAFRPTPRWPSDTDQFGVYYVRGPW